MRILFAIGHREAEDYIKALLDDKNKERQEKGEETVNYEIVGYVVHKDQILESIASKGPDILILREGLDGPTDIYKLAEGIRIRYPNVRIIFIAGNRGIGDKKLANLVGRSVYDIIVGQNVNISEVVELIDNPKSFADVSKYLPKDEDLIDDFEDEENEKNNAKNNEMADEIIAETLINNDENKQNQTNQQSLVQKMTNPLVKVVGGGKKGETTEDLQRQLDEQQKEINKLKNGQNANVVIVNGKQDLNGNGNAKGKQSLIDKSKGVIGDSITAIKNKNRMNSENNPSLEELSARRGGRGGRGNVVYSGKDKIVTFWGAKNGIGTTIAAFSTAMELALRRNKVLYIEYNENNPMIAYWLGIYDATNFEDGIDRAILGYELNALKDVNEAITTRENLIQGSSDFSDNFKKFPPTLDMLFFSESYLLKRDKEPISSSSFTQLLLYYMQQLNYNYIIVDIKTGTDLTIVEKSLTFSNRNFIVLSQEFSSIGYYKQFFDSLNKKGLDFTQKNNGNRSAVEKNSYIINRYSGRVKLNEKEIRNWIESNKTFIIPDNSEEIYDLAFSCRPLISASRNRSFRDAISNIASDIESL